MNSVEVVDRLRTDPIALMQVLWPQYYLYDKQIEIVKSVDDNYETFVHAGNMLGRVPPSSNHAEGGIYQGKTSSQGISPCVSF